VSRLAIPWEPLVEGDTAARALAAVEAIARDLAGEPEPEASGLDLNRGLAGRALFFAYLERATGDAAAGERAGELLERAIVELGEQRSPSPSLYDGFAGLAWVVEHLVAGEVSQAGRGAGVAGARSDDETDEDDSQEDLNAGIDAALLALLRLSPWRGEVDLLGGLVGYGVYALERLPRPSAAALLSLVVARLAERAEPAARIERGSPGLVWVLPESPALAPDPGMAHGAAGAIALLARVVARGAAEPLAETLLAAAVEGVLGLRRAEEEGKGDLAWCAGDAGLSVALLAAARACDREDWEETALRLATGAAARYLHDSEAEGFDPALCHGTAGLSHLFHRLYWATGDPALGSAARRWLERTLAHWRPGEGIGGYLVRKKQEDGRAGWVADPGFLGGAAGIGLALLAAASPIEPAWDRLLLLSGRVPSRKVDTESAK
jgi:hypothetical protein